MVAGGVDEYLTPSVATVNKWEQFWHDNDTA